MTSPLKASPLRSSRQVPLKAVPFKTLATRSPRTGLKLGPYLQIFKPHSRAICPTALVHCMCAWLTPSQSVVPKTWGTFEGTISQSVMEGEEYSKTTRTLKKRQMYLKSDLNIESCPHSSMPKSTSKQLFSPRI